jgi:hypothetical protein
VLPRCTKEQPQAPGTATERLDSRRAHGAYWLRSMRPSRLQSTSFPGQPGSSKSSGSSVGVAGVNCQAFSAETSRSSGLRSSVDVRLRTFDLRVLRDRVGTRPRHGDLAPETVLGSLRQCSCPVIVYERAQVPQGPGLFPFLRPSSPADPAVSQLGNTDSPVNGGWCLPFLRRMTP